jgi:hypothetical protein
LDARLTNLLCEKKNIVAKSKEVKTGGPQICQNLLRKAMAQKWLFCNDDDDDDKIGHDRNEALKSVIEDAF